MITIIHGDDQVSSRKHYTDIKKTKPGFDGSKVTLSEIMQILEGGDLFEDKKELFVENFFSKRKPGKELSEITEYIKKNDKRGEIYFWEEKEITGKNLSFFIKPQTKLFKIPKNIFIFLGNIKPGNKNLIKEFHNLLLTTEVAFVSAMMIRQIRLLLAVSDTKSQNKIDEIRNIASWQQSKLINQAHLFKEEELKIIYNKLFKIDLALKTGALGLSLTQSIDMLLLDI